MGKKRKFELGLSLTLVLTLLAIPFYFKGNMGSQLDFHPSWNEA